jgi:hypothetical protein
MRKEHKKSKAALSVLILLGLWNSPGYAMEQQIISANGKEMFKVQYYDMADDNANVQAVFNEPFKYNLSEGLKNSVNQAVNRWANILSMGSENVQPLQVVVGTYADKNAQSYGYTWLNGKDTDNPNMVKDIIQNGATISDIDLSVSANKPSNHDYAVGIIQIGKYFGANQHDGNYGWVVTDITQMPQVETGAALATTVFHELGHTLGINATQKIIKENGSKYYGFSDETSNAVSWNAHLIDQYGNAAKQDMKIITSYKFKKIKNNDPTIMRESFFIVDDLSDAFTPSDTSVPTSGKAYFVGNNVSMVLDGKTFQGVDGIPINGWEDNKPEFSHIELKRCLMSHQYYRSYNTFTEAELAIMQDIGYNIDRRKYYGYSLYKDNQVLTNANGYSERNAEGTAYLPGVYSTTELGVGLHIYGSNNNVTQAADILTSGIGAVGIRIDGIQDTVTVAKDAKVCADGKNGAGILVAYGKENTVHIDGVVTATGTNGNGVQFDFGANSLGGDKEYRGSYIWYGRSVSPVDGAITFSTNLKPSYETSKAEFSEFAGPMGSLEIAGTLVGSGNAVDIAKNAFVNKIDVLDGAAIEGNITSDWKHFSDELYGGKWSNDSEPLKLQYNNGYYVYSSYIPDLVTNLNFNTSGPINYSGNIKGADNIRLNVNNGTLNYTGAADVIDVEIAEGASLLGSGSYKVNDMSASLASGFSDPQMGKVINHGTIGATTGDVSMSGDFISDGNIAVTPIDNSSKVYLLNVDGKAELKSDAKTTSLVAQGNNKPLLNKKYNYLTATNGITGNINTSKLSDYVTATGTVNGNNAFFTASQTKALGDTTGLNENEGSVARAFNNAAPNLMQQENTVGQQAANVFYNKAGDMKKLMNSVTAAERTKLLGQTPMSNLTANALYSRLDTNAFDGMLGVLVQVPSLDGENKTVNTNVPVALDANNNFWLKMFRGFEGYGGSDGESDLNNQSFGGVVGYDKAAGKDARIGGFFAYGKTNYSADYLTGNSSDWRFGLYGDKQNGDWEYQGYVSYGANHYDLDASTRDGGAKLNSDFKAKIWDVGLKAKYTIPSTKEKTWKIRPYGELGYTHTSQDSYTESGSSAFAKNIDSVSNNSTRAEVGVEFKRRITPTSGWGGSIGYKRILSGVNPELNGTFVGGTDSFTVKTENDRNYLTYNLNAYTSLGGKWTGQAEIRGEKSSNNHKEVYSISAKYHF